MLREGYKKRLTWHLAGRRRVGGRSEGEKSGIRRTRRPDVAERSVRRKEGVEESLLGNQPQPNIPKLSAFPAPPPNKRTAAC